MDRKGGLLALFLRLKVEDEAEREWEKKRSCRRLGEMHEDVHDVEDGRKRGEDSPLGGWRVVTTGPAWATASGARSLALASLARTPTEDGWRVSLARWRRHGARLDACSALLSGGKTGVTGLTNR